MAADETRAPAVTAVIFRRETLRLMRDVAKARFGGRLVVNGTHYTDKRSRSKLGRLHHTLRRHRVQGEDGGGQGGG